MTPPPLHRLAQAAGLSPQWTDYRGQPRIVADEVLRAVLRAQGIDADGDAQIADSLRRLGDSGARPALLIVDAGMPWRRPQAMNRAGRFRLEREDGTHEDHQLQVDEPLPAIDAPGHHRLVADDGQVQRIAVTPPRCFGVADVGRGRRRLWGLAAQVYALSSAGDGGIGHFGAVGALARAAAARGADAIAISPVHAGFDAYPDHYGPYSPSSRFALNPLYADPASVFGARQMRAALAAAHLDDEYAELESLSLIDWPRATRARARLHRTLYAQLLGSDGPERVEFEAFRRGCAPSLYAHACFEALHRFHVERATPLYNWRDWPAAYADAGSAEVARFADEHAEELGYHLFLQWLADRSLAIAQSRALDAGMAIGVIGDLAIGTDACGSHAWSRPSDMLLGLGIGAPPDMLNIHGQNWGLAAMSPRAMRDGGYRSFIELLQRNLHRVGGLRIDHVLGLRRMWLIPDGGAPTDGVYLGYPFEDLCRLVALESWRHRAIVIGEDLGTVPEGFRAQLAERGILGIDVMWFVREHGLYTDPRRWSGTAIATASTHDMPTVFGWWQGRDLEWRSQLGLFGERGDDSAASARAEREVDRSALWAAFTHAGIVDGPMPDDIGAAELLAAAAAYVGLSPSPLTLLSLEDALLQREQPNIPGTRQGHPNWCRRLPDPETQLLLRDDVRAVLAALAEARALDTAP